MREMSIYPQNCQMNPYGKMPEADVGNLAGILTGRAQCLRELEEDPENQKEQFALILEWLHEAYQANSYELDSKKWMRPFAKIRGLSDLEQHLVEQTYPNATPDEQLQLLQTARESLGLTPPQPDTYTLPLIGAMLFGQW